MASFLELLKKDPQLGLGMFYPAPGIIERIGPHWEWIWVDGQHGEFAYNDVLGAVRASNYAAKPVVVRVPGHEQGSIGLTLDMAPDAVMVPMVESAEEAKRIVDAAKFPPLGRRSYGARRPIDLYGRAYAHMDRPQGMLICQIESEPGLKNVEEIAAVDGVDALFFGPDDMALRRGMPMDKPRPDGIFDAALKVVADACKKHGKIAGGVFTTPDALKKGVELGYHLNVGSSDVALLVTGSLDIVNKLRKAVGKGEATGGPAYQLGVY